MMFANSSKLIMTILMIVKDYIIILGPELQYKHRRRKLKKHGRQVNRFDKFQWSKYQ